MGQKTKGLTAVDLTRGESMRIYRDRLRFTEIQMAVEYGVCLSEYRAMELDEEGVRTPYVSISPLQDFESCATLRRRKGLSQAELSREIGVDVYQLGHMELGSASASKLIRFWGEASQ